MSASTISPRMRAFVLRRDGYRCVAPVIDGKAGWCRDAFGNVITRWPDRDPGPQYLQVNHVKPQGELAMGKKATAEPRNLISLCAFHHTGTEGGSNWEAVHRNRIRDYLDEIHGDKRR